MNILKENRIDTFCLTVEFKQDTTSPHLLFQSIANMIMELQSVDKALTKCISSEIEPMFVLDEVEKGSIKVWLQQLLKDIPDEGLAELDAKKILGAFLVKAKHKIIEKMDEPKYLNEPANVEVLCGELLEMAKETNILIPSTFAQIDSPRMLQSMNRMSQIAGQLPEGSRFVYSSKSGDTHIGTKFLVPEEFIVQLAEKEYLQNENTMIIKVKQPDYLGNAQWVFKHNNKRMLCNFEDEDWLLNFHSRKINIGPGDSLKVLMDVRVGYDKNNEVISERFTIKKVVEVIPFEDSEQTEINYLEG